MGALSQPTHRHPPGGGGGGGGGSRYGVLAAFAAALVILTLRSSSAALKTTAVAGGAASEAAAALDPAAPEVVALAVDGARSAAAAARKPSSPQPPPARPICDLERTFDGRQLRWRNCTTPADRAKCEHDFGRTDVPVLPRYNRATCDLGSFSRGWARACLRDKHVLFFGDSLTRYQYLNLVYWLHTGRWAPQGMSVNGTWRALELSPDFANRWNRFFRATSSRLGGKEICDCHRLREWRTAVENRYFYDPASNTRVSQLQWFGTFPSKGHSLAALNVTCQAARFAAAKKARRAGGGGGGGSRGSARGLAAATTAGSSLPPCRQGGCTPGRCGGKPDWEVSPPVGMLPLVTQLAPDVVVFNVGQWHPWADPERQQSLVDFARGLRAKLPRVRLIWKTTTPLRDFDRQRDPHLLQAKAGLLRRLVDDAGVELLHAFNLTVGLVNAPAAVPPAVGYADKVHLAGWAYTLLNKVLLAQVCGTDAPRGGGAAAGGGGADAEDAAG